MKSMHTWGFQKSSWKVHITNKSCKDLKQFWHQNIHIFWLYFSANTIKCPGLVFFALNPQHLSKWKNKHTFPLITETTPFSPPFHCSEVRGAQGRSVTLQSEGRSFHHSRIEENSPCPGYDPQLPSKHGSSQTHYLKCKNSVIICIFSFLPLIPSAPDVKEQDSSRIWGLLEPIPGQRSPSHYWMGFSQIAKGHVFIILLLPKGTSALKLKYKFRNSGNHQMILVLKFKRQNSHPLLNSANARVG